MSNAQQIVELLLENVRVCAFCQKERGIRGQPGESHGFCRRHFMQNYADMFTPQEIAAMPDADFSPDMEQQQ